LSRFIGANSPISQPQGCDLGRQTTIEQSDALEERTAYLAFLARFPPAMLTANFAHAYPDTAT
jgi:hypothetical protein